MPVPDSQRAPVGSSYLELRARLGTALFALEEAAAEARATPAGLRALPALQARLREPLLLLFIGETNAGKSALCNALFGCALCPTGAVPITHTVEVFLHGSPARDLPLAPGVTECHRPLRFLRDFHIVDTPGSDATVAENWIISENFAPRADLIIVVFNTVRPWGDTPWQFLQRLPESARRNVLCVLQQADLRAEREIAAVRDHLRQTALQRLGRTFPIFPVSAKKAFLARTTGVDKERLWEESRFEPFERQVSQAIAGNAARREGLHAASRVAQNLFRDIQAGVAGQIREFLRVDRTRLDQLRAVIGEIEARTREQIAGYLGGCEAACERVAREGERELQEQPRPPAALQLVFSRQRGWTEAFGKKMEAALREAVAAEIERLSAGFEEHLRSVWRQMHEQFRGDARHQTGPAIAPSDAAGVAFDRQRAQLSGEVQLVILGHQADPQIRRQLDDLFAGLPTDAAGGALPARILARLDGLAVFDCRALVEQLNAAPVFGSRRVTLETFAAVMTEKRAEISAALAALLDEAGVVLHRQLVSLIEPLKKFFGSPDDPRRLLLERLEALESNLAGIASLL